MYASIYTSIYIYIDTVYRNYNDFPLRSQSPCGVMYQQIATVVVVLVNLTPSSCCCSSPMWDLLYLWYLIR